MAIVAGDGYVCAGDDDRVEVTIGRFAEGLKSRLDASFVWWKGWLTVVPSKMTAAPVCRSCRSMVLDGGTEISERRMLEQDATAEEMEA